VGERYVELVLGEALFYFWSDLRDMIDFFAFAGVGSISRGH
jgi:hypothetical protein